jgi:hypothetical protein
MKLLLIEINLFQFEKYVTSDDFKKSKNRNSGSDTPMVLQSREQHLLSNRRSVACTNGTTWHLMSLRYINIIFAL